ncbi:hypothetical protein OH77DRAFT_564214 [Trametes cingulata]|nr:hypothetical protein OH77DRAFT_564214 [Trametes cingulata]
MIIVAKAEKCRSCDREDMPQPGEDNGSATGRALSERRCYGHFRLHHFECSANRCPHSEACHVGKVYGFLTLSGSHSKYRTTAANLLTCSITSRSRPSAWIHSASQIHQPHLLMISNGDVTVPDKPADLCIRIRGMCVRRSVLAAVRPYQQRHVRHRYIYITCRRIHTAAPQPSKLAATSLPPWRLRHPQIMLQPGCSPWAFRFWGRPSRHPLTGVDN